MTKRGDFYEEDEPVEDVIRAFENGQPVVTWGTTWFSPQITITHSDNLTLHCWKTPWGGSND